MAAANVLEFLIASQPAGFKMEPGVIAALGVLLGATEVATTKLVQASATPLNVSLDAETVAKLYAVWPAVVAFAQALGVRL